MSECAVTKKSQSRKKLLATLRESLATATPVRIQRAVEPEEVLQGVVLELSEEWVLLADIRDGAYLDGYRVLRLTDLVDRGGVRVSGGETARETVDRRAGPVEKEEPVAAARHAPVPLGAAHGQGPAQGRHPGELRRRLRNSRAGGRRPHAASDPSSA